MAQKDPKLAEAHDAMSKLAERVADRNIIHMTFGEGLLGFEQPFGAQRHNGAIVGLLLGKVFTKPRSPGTFDDGSVAASGDFVLEFTSEAAIDRFIETLGVVKRVIALGNKFIESINEVADKTPEGSSGVVDVATGEIEVLNVEPKTGA